MQEKIEPMIESPKKFINQQITVFYDLSKPLETRITSGMFFLYFCKDFLFQKHNIKILDVWKKDLKAIEEERELIAFMGGKYERELAKNRRHTLFDQMIVPLFNNFMLELEVHSLISEVYYKGILPDKGKTGYRIPVSDEQMKKDLEEAKKRGELSDEKHDTDNYSE